MGTHPIFESDFDCLTDHTKMATDYMRSMLNELMGSTPDNQDNENEPSSRYQDRDVCRSFLLKCCPHEVLTSTRADIGECRYDHNLALRSDYERARVKDPTLFFEFDAYKSLKSFIKETDSKIDIAKKKLAEKQQDISNEIEVNYFDRIYVKNVYLVDLKHIFNRKRQTAYTR